MADVRPFDLALGEGLHQAQQGDDDDRSEKHPSVVAPWYVLILGDIELVFRQLALRLESLCLCLAHGVSPYTGDSG